MNENPEGTQNPPTTTPTPTPGAAGAGTAQNVPVESLDPNGRPMEKAAPAAEPAKKKTGLIVGLIIGAVVLIGAIVAVVLLLPGMNRGDPVTAAMQKIMNGGMPTNVAVGGDITLSLKQAGLPIKKVNVGLDAQAMTNSMINNSKMKITFTMNNGKDYSFELAELYAENGDLFFKIEGATDALDDSGLIDYFVNPNLVTDCATNDVDCVGAETASSSATTDAIIDVVEEIDGVWFKISTDEIKSISGGTVESNESIKCLTEAADSLRKSANTTASAYNKYPFVTSTSEKVTVPSKQSTVYQIGIDSENFTGFANELNNSSAAAKLYECMDADEKAEIDEEGVEQLVAHLPALFVEVDGNDNFSRLYFTTDFNEGDYELVVDLTFAYPTNINVSEPAEYQNVSEFLQQMMGQ